MFQYLLRSFVIVSLLVCSACVPKTTSELKDALSLAVKQDKISPKKMESILKEHEMLREEDKEKAREYVLQIVNAIKMGGDSSHIEVVRKQVAGPSEIRI